MTWRNRLVEYVLVVLVAMLVAGAIIYFVMPRSTVCTTCSVSMPRLRAECDKQFYSSGTASVRQLDAGWEEEELVAFVEPAGDQDTNDGAPPGGYSSATTPSSSSSIVREPGYLMIRVQPRVDYSGSSASYDTSTTRPETSWDEIKVTVARYINPLRNDKVCDGSVRFREGKFEFYCDIPTKLEATDYGQMSYRIFVRNESSVALEYCVVSNCDASAPWGAGTFCQAEQGQQ
jgi:hypothetical protein